MVFLGFAKSDRAGQGDVQKNLRVRRRHKLFYKTATAACFMPAVGGKIIRVGSINFLCHLTLDGKPRTRAKFSASLWAAVRGRACFR
jgi:hypothetical protein